MALVSSVRQQDGAKALKRCHIRPLQDCNFSIVSQICIYRIKKLESVQRIFTQLLEGFRERYCLLNAKSAFTQNAAPRRAASC